MSRPPNRSLKNEYWPDTGLASRYEVPPQSTLRTRAFPMDRLDNSLRVRKGGMAQRITENLYTSRRSYTNDITRSLCRQESSLGRFPYAL